MKILFCFVAVLLSYLTPLYFEGDLSLPMLLESGIRSGVVVSVCAWAYRDFKPLLFIIVMELSLIITIAIIIMDWETHLTGLDLIISEVNAVVFWIELLILLVGGVCAIARDYLHSRHTRNSGQNSIRNH